MLGVGAKRLRDLDAELARGSENERLRLLGLRIEELQHRQAEGGGLAGAGLRLTDDVVSGEQLGDRLLLDRRRVGIAERVERVEDLIGQAELAKGGH